MKTATTLTTQPDADFDLDVTVLEAGPIVAELMRSTDDNCGSTCASACTSCS